MGTWDDVFLWLPPGQGLQVTTDQGPWSDDDRHGLPAALEMYLHTAWPTRTRLLHWMVVTWAEALDVALRADVEDRAAVSLGRIAAGQHMTLLHVGGVRWRMVRADGDVDPDSREPARDWNPATEPNPRHRDGWLAQCHVSGAAVRWAQGPLTRYR